MRTLSAGPGARPSRVSARPDRRMDGSSSCGQQSWLQQLGSLFSRRPVGALPAASAAAYAIVGPSSNTAGPTSLQQAEDASKKEHLVVMVHGLFGHRANWTHLAQLLNTHLDPATTLLFASTANERAKTFEGVDACGERLAEEIRAQAAAYPSLKRITVLAHSMGGLISRFALGRLYNPRQGTIAGLQPCHFVAIASPHLGCDGLRSPAQVPLIDWAAAVPGIGGTVQWVMQEAAVPFSSLWMGRVGSQFFLMDRDGGRPPLLARMAYDQPTEGCYYWSALASFETRTLYANSSGDHLVGWANSSLRRLEELPRKEGRGRGVVREDPLEAAWWPDAARRVHAGPAAAQLHSAQGRSVTEDEIMRADSPEALAGHGHPGGSSITSSNGSSSIMDKQGPASSKVGVFNVPVAAGERAAAATSNSSQVGVETEALAAAAVAAGSSSSSLDSSSSSSSSRGGSTGALTGPASAAASSSGLLPEGWRLLSFEPRLYDYDRAAQRPQFVEQILTSLQGLPWRRVDVCFADTVLPLLSHQHIQVQREWANWVGAPVAKHLVLQLVGMEELRAQQQRESAGD